MIINLLLQSKISFHSGNNDINMFCQPILLKYPPGCDRMVVEFKTTLQSVPIITKVVRSKPAKGAR